MWVDRGDKIGKTNDFQFLKLVFFFSSSVFKLTSENSLQLFLHVKRVHEFSIIISASRNS